MFLDIISPFAVNFGMVYLQFYQFIDPVLAFTLFMALANWVFTKRYNSETGREGKMVAVAVALALTFGFALFEMFTGFYFGHPVMQGLAGIVMLLVFGIFLYELLKNAGDNKHNGCMLAFTYTIMYTVFMSAFSPVYVMMTGRYSLLAAILGVLFLTAFIALIICLARLIGGGKKGDDGHGGHGPHDTHDAHHDSHDDHHDGHDAHDHHDGHGSHEDHHEEEAHHINEEKKREEESKKIQPHFEKLVQQIGALDADIRGFKQYGEQLLVYKQKLIQGTASMDDFGATLQAFTAHGNAIAERLPVIQGLISEINKRKLSALSAQNRQTLGIVYKEFFSMATSVDTYMIEFQRKYNSIGVAP